MKLATYDFFDPTAPDDVQEHRKHSLEAHRLHGEAVILKSRFTELDVREGTTIRCPYDHDNVMEQSRQWDPYCFGTGYLGGFADAVITFATILDTSIDKVRIGKEGALYLEKQPQFVHPWIPTIGTGDLLIRAIFNPNDWDVEEFLDRYIVDTVTPITLRGHGNYPRRFVTQQSCQISLLPSTHELYTVPLEFDYNNLPAPPDPGPGIDPDPIPAPSDTNITDLPDEDVEVILPIET